MPAPSRTTPGTRRVALLSAVVVVALAGCIGPPAEPLVSNGDGRPSGAGVSRLERDVQSTFDNDYERAAVAVIDDGEVVTVFAEADEDTVFEIGSITKVLTGELLAIAVERGEVGLDDPLGRFLSLGDAPVASVTLRSLATHSSGLPWDPTDPEWVAGR